MPPSLMQLGGTGVPPHGTAVVGIEPARPGTTYVVVDIDHVADGRDRAGDGPLIPRAQGPPAPGAGAHWVPAAGAGPTEGRRWVRRLHRGSRRPRRDDVPSDAVPPDAVPPVRPGALTDRIANRALLLVALTGVGVAVYALSFAVFGPQGPVHTAGAVLVGGALAAVLLLVRDRLQRGVDWLLYGDRKVPERAILRVGRQAEAVTDPDSLLDALAATLAETLRLSYVEVVPGDGPGRAAGGGADPPRHRGGPRPPRAPAGRPAGRAARGGAEPTRRAGPLRRRAAARRRGGDPAAAAQPGRRPRARRSVPARRSAAGCAATCTTSSARRWPASAWASTPPAAVPGATPPAPTGSSARCRTRCGRCVAEIRKIIEGLRPPVAGRARPAGRPAPARRRDRRAQPGPADRRRGRPSPRRPARRRRGGGLADRPGGA